jgi:hypothetical protein
MNLSDVIALAALVVSAYAIYQSHLANKRSIDTQRQSQASEATVARQRLVDQILLEADALTGDVRLHGGAVTEMKLRAKTMEARSGSRNLSTTDQILRACEGKRIEAEDKLQLAQPVLSGGEEGLSQRTAEELRVLLRNLKQARNRLRVLNEETVSLLPDDRFAAP